MNIRELVQELERRLGPEDAALLLELKQALGADEERVLRMSRLAEFGATSASAIHELRQPLMAIKAYAQMARETYDPNVRDQMQALLSQVDRMEKVMLRHRTFLERDDRERSAVSLTEVAQAALNALSHHLGHSRVKLVTRLEADLPRIQGQQSQLLHAVSNLIANAADAVNAVGGGQVQVATGVEDSQVFITVSDWGSGIPAAVQAKLFTPFFTTKGVEKGTGLGLMIAQRVAQNHGGKLELIPGPSDQANPPKTVFRISLPIEAT
jgi:signal transduction histidine kinase